MDSSSPQPGKLLSSSQFRASSLSNPISRQSSITLLVMAKMRPSYVKAPRYVRQRRWSCMHWGPLSLSIIDSVQIRLLPRWPPEWLGTFPCTVDGDFLALVAAMTGAQSAQLRRPLVHACLLPCSPLQPRCGLPIYVPGTTKRPTLTAQEKGKPKGNGKKAARL